MIFKAIGFATAAHSGQYRKQTQIPYIVHPLNVAKILLQYGCSDELAVAAILHDTVEDTSVSLQDIRENFGNEIARLVEGASEPDKSQPWEIRKQHTIDVSKRAPLEVLLLICADKLDNLRSIREELEIHGESVWTKFSRPKEKQAWYHRALADIFLSRIEGESSMSLFQEFKREVDGVFYTGDKS